MTASVLEMTKELVMAQIEAQKLLPEDMQKELHKTYASLMALKMREETNGIGQEVGAKPVDWKKSISRHTVTCLECGAVFRQLSAMHLRHHGLDGRGYRVKYGIPRAQPLAARAVTAIRKEIAQRSRPWESAPRYVQAHRGKAAAKASVKRARAKRG
jgi:predicted transcriptional regulator